MANYKQQVVELLKSFETGDSKPIAYINPNKYVQHNLAAGDCLAGLRTLFQVLPKGSAKVNTVRVFQDGNFVFAHTDYNFFGPKVGFDIFRFEDGKNSRTLGQPAGDPNRSQSQRSYDDRRTNPIGGH